MLALLLWAVDEAGGNGGGAPAPQPPNPLNNPMFLIIPLFLLFWLLVLRPMNRRQEQERQSLLSALEKNDQVLTIGGIYATVISVSEKEDEMVVRLEDNVRMKMTRSSVSRNFSKEQRVKDAQQQTANKEPNK